MSRAKKLIIVCFVLAVGIALAWPFRKQNAELMPSEAPDAQRTASQQAGSGDSSTLELPMTLGKDSGQGVAAQMASTGEPANPIEFDLQSHPALAGSEPQRAATQRVAPTPPRTSASDESPVTPTYSGQIPGSRPVYSTGQTSLPEEAAWPEEVVHVVHHRDTLEKLAERYLGDASRALELFDLNRDQIANPHLLPVGAELRIPVPARSDED